MRRGALTQTAFARRIGISQSALNRIEVADQNVTIDTLFEICSRLKITAGELLDDKLE